MAKKNQNEDDIEERARAIVATYPVVVKACGGGYIGYTSVMPGVVSQGLTQQACFGQVLADQADAVAELLRAGLDLPGTVRTEQVNVRLTTDERDLLAEAAEESGSSVSEFVRDAALAAARAVNPRRGSSGRRRRGGRKPTGSDSKSGR